MKFDAVLKTFKEFFEREDIRYALAGGLAIVSWGHQRPTNDADFVVDGANGSRIRAFAESLGYETTHVSNGFSNHRHPDRSFGDLDLMYVYGDTAEQVFAGSRPRNALGILVPVTRPEHLIAMKVAAMKNSPMRVLIDAPDIAYLLTLPDVDREKAREYFAKHGLLKIYDELTRDQR